MWTFRGTRLARTTLTFRDSFGRPSPSEERHASIWTGALLPRGLPPGKYAMCAAALVTGQSMEVALPDDLEWAVRLSAGLVPGVPLKSVRKWRKTRLRHF